MLRRIVRIALFLCGGFAALTVAFIGAEALLASIRPPQPLPLGTIQWTGEVGVTVDSVRRVASIGRGRHALHARGVFYIVDARILAPFGLRPTWHDSYVRVETFSGSGGTMREGQFAVDERAQAILDRRTGRPGPVHLVRGAQQREDLVFDLPKNIEQPALVFLPANSFEGLFDIVWQPHRFNLRYD